MRALWELARGCFDLARVRWAIGVLPGWLVLDLTRLAVGVGWVCLGVDGVVGPEVGDGVWGEEAETGWLLVVSCLLKKSVINRWWV